MILHVDMDAFFASVEQLDDPRLRDRCVLVGGLSDRGVVAACSYEARRYGIHSAMPMFQARRKCPDAVVVPPRRTRYKELSLAIMDTLRDFSPQVEPVSIDEAYVDISGCGKLHGDPVQIARAVKKSVQRAVGLTCSIGVAPVKFLAKIASDLDKPDGLTVIPPESVPAFIETLPLGKVPGVGPKMKRQLRTLGMKTLGDIRACPEKTLNRHLGKYGVRLKELSLGIDKSKVSPESQVKSISSEETLAANTRDKKMLARYLLRQAETVSRQLRRKRFRAKTVILKLKHDNFTSSTRQSPLPRPTQSADPIFQAASRLLEEYRMVRDIRLIGLGVSRLLPTDTPLQMQLFSDTEPANGNWEKVDRAVDSITERFGKGSIHRASLKDN